MKWTQIRAACAAEDIDRVAAVFSALNSNLMIEDRRDVREFNPNFGELIEDELLQNTDRGAVSMFLSEECNPAESIAFLQERLTALEIPYDFTVGGVEEADWENNWKQYYHPIEIGQRLVIVPEWEYDDYKAKDGQLIVMMDPGMAFGPGTHESTQLCASIMEESLPAGAKALDVGTGSGILAICALKLGAASVDAYDIDPMAVRVAKENFARNQVNVHCEESDLLGAVHGCYDYVMANLTAEILLRLSEQIGRFVRCGGQIVMSGIIDPQCNQVIEAMQAAGFELLEERHQNGWTGLLMRKL